MRARGTTCIAEANKRRTSRQNRVNTYLSFQGQTEQAFAERRPIRCDVDGIEASRARTYPVKEKLAMKKLVGAFHCRLARMPPIVAASASPTEAATASVGREV